MSELISRLISRTSSTDEVATLQQLHNSLTKASNVGDADVVKPSLKERTLHLDLSGTEDGNGSSALPQILCTSQDDLNHLMCYVFDRRFGWSETGTEDGKRVRRLSTTGATLSAGTEKEKAVINNLLDQFIKWYLQQELNIPLLIALKYTIKQTVNMPVVRNRAVIHMMDWCKNNADQLTDNRFFKEIQELVTLSITDVWSAIRNACANRLSYIVSNLSEEQTRSLFEGLVPVCSGDSSWQRKEGAIMGINAVLQRYQNRSSSSKSPMSSPRVLETETDDQRMPDFIQKKIHQVLFDLLSHTQLTIREHAAKTLATYITCSSISTALATLKEVVLTLKKGSATYSDNTQASGQLLDDYASEGFLGVCMFLVKVIPLSYLLPVWPEYISTFLLYLSHPASTVRQAASSVFKYLVVKSSHSVVVLKLILQALAMGWSPDTESMTSEISSDTTDVGQPWPSVADYTGSNLSSTWEGREGRLFAYELIFKYLIKNHWLYTFGPAGSGLQTDQNSGKDNVGSANENPVKHYDTSLLLPSDRGMHHVESEKCLAVRFLSQTDLFDKSHPNHVSRPIERFMTIDEESEKPEFYLSNGSGPMYSGHRLSGEPPPVPGQFDNTFSLLTQARIIDNNIDGLDSENSSVRQELQLKKLKLLVDINKNSAVSCKCGWMEEESLQDMSRILKVILFQTAESLGHSQWELRRIANQVLPCVAEVIRWYDVNLLVTVWNSYLNVAVPTSLMTFISVLLLKESVIHAVKLVPLLLKPPHTWQDHDSCKDYISGITSTIRRRLPAYLPHLLYLIQRRCQDRLSVQAADIVLLAYGHMEIDTKERESHFLPVLEFWKRLFYFAHPRTRISAELLSQYKLQADEILSPLEGYLSCCLVKPDNKLQCAKQVEKQFMNDMVHRLPSFLEGLSAPNMTAVAPMLAHYIGLFVEESHMCKMVTDQLQASACRIVQYSQDEADSAMKQLSNRCIIITLKELAAVIAMKSIDLPLIQKLLLIYEELCKAVGLGQHLALVMTGIASRLHETMDFPMDDCGQQDLTADDLYLMSNDIPTSDSPEPEEDSDSEEAIIGTPVGNRFLESLTLNTSNNSGGSLTGRLSALSLHSSEAGGGGGGDAALTPRESEGSEDGESSDWDSWDEEEETQSVFSGVFSEFLIKLQRSNKVEFASEMMKLREKDRSLITTLLKS